MRHWRRYCNIAPCLNNLGLGWVMNLVNAKNAGAVKVKWGLLRHAPIEKYFDGGTTAGKFIGQCDVDCDIPETSIFAKFDSALASKMPSSSQAI